MLRIIDGDTFEARVRVWPGLDVDTKVRLRGIDAAELHARCADELAQAQAARTALETILADGGVAISRVGVDKYGGRVDAAVSTRSTADVSAALLNGGFARSYDGGKRGAGAVSGNAEIRPAYLRHHPRADADTAVKVFDVRIVHADAAMRHEAADRTLIVGAVDGVLRRHRKGSSPRRPSDFAASRPGSPAEAGCSPS